LLLRSGEMSDATGAATSVAVRIVAFGGMLGHPCPDKVRSGFSPVAVAGKNVSGSTRRPVSYGVMMINHRWH